MRFSPKKKLLLGAHANVWHKLDTALKCIFSIIDGKKYEGPETM